MDTVLAARGGAPARLCLGEVSRLKENKVLEESLGKWVVTEITFQTVGGGRTKTWGGGKPRVQGEPHRFAPRDPACGWIRLPWRDRSGRCGHRACADLAQTALSGREQCPPTGKGRLCKALPTPPLRREAG